MPKSRRPKIIGTGLAALDLVVENTRLIRKAAGGTCANVLSILAYLGWRCSLLARLGADCAAEDVLQDLRIWGVETSHSAMKPSANTPIIVERIRKDSRGTPFHTFSFTCPGCGRRLPSYQPLTSAVIREVLEDLGKTADIAFIDRVSRGALDLANHVAEAGGVVVFEPSAIRDEKQFSEMLKIAHILKYSHETLRDFAELSWSESTLLEVQTLGRGGVRFRSKLARLGGRWHHMQAPPITDFRDACGAGDWFTAGMLHRLLRGGVSHFRNSSKDDLLQTMGFAQQLAVWNCKYPGARGGMYSIEGRAELRSLAHINRDCQPSSCEAEDSHVASQICGCEASQNALQPMKVATKKIF
jgi:sugar/nucleoside kinase (ribokinase family)